MGILEQQLKIGERVVNGRDVDIGEMFGQGHAVALSQQRVAEDSKKTSGYYSGSEQGGSDNRTNLYPNNLMPSTPNMNYKGWERINTPRPPRPVVKPPPPVDDPPDVPR